MIRALRIQFKKLCFLNLLWIAFLGFSLQAQLSDKAQISIITCDSGQDLYSSFGHSAFRVQDSAKGINWVYNYGTFDFNTPNFYYKFARGKLLYSLSVTTFSDLGIGLICSGIVLVALAALTYAVFPLKFFRVQCGLMLLVLCRPRITSGLSYYYTASEQCVPDGK